MSNGLHSILISIVLCCIRTVLKVTNCQLLLERFAYNFPQPLPPNISP